MIGQKDHAFKKPEEKLNGKLDEPMSPTIVYKPFSVDNLLLWSVDDGCHEQLLPMKELSICYNKKGIIDSGKQLIAWLTKPTS